MKYPDKVALLKKAKCVSGKPLLHGNPSDEKIDEQIDIMLNAISRDDDEIKKESSRIYSKIDFSWSEKEAKKFITEEFHKFVGFTNGELDNNFWRNFGSAPCYQIYEDKKKNGSVGMDTIFGEKFNDCYSYCYEIPGAINSLVESFKKKKKLQNKNNIVSQYKDLKELEENVVAKKIKDEAKIYFNDKTKPLNKRLEVFDKYGKTESSIHHPSNPSLAKIFEIFQESDYLERHETIECSYVIQYWIEKLKERRSQISYKNNKYHPEIISKRRNYKPRKEAIERLQNYYLGILLEEGVSSFEFDW